MDQGSKGFFRGIEQPRPEIVFGLVGAIGTDLDLLEHELRTALSSVSYVSSSIRVSEILSEEYERMHPEEEVTGSRLGTFMDRGDALRIAVDHGAAAAALAVARIVNQRKVVVGAKMAERASHATIIRSLKHPAEVGLLRAVYGPRLVVIGAWSMRDHREDAVRKRLNDEHPGNGVGWYAEKAAELVLRDEMDADSRLGQRVRETFELADAFVAIRPGRPITKPVERIVQLLFGKPFLTPTVDEHSMFQASGAGFRSSAAGRQVGAVIVDDDGELLVAGTNDVPKAGGGQYWAGDDPDHRDFQHGYDINDRLKSKIVEDILSRLKDAPGWLSDALLNRDLPSLTREALQPGGPLSGSRVGDLLEFGRVAHAEMAAVCTAARRGVPIRSATVYSTTYPCHECARLLIACGIRRLVYVDPYPKSQVPEMYKNEVVEGDRKSVV